MCRGGPAGCATAATRGTGRDAYLPVAENFLDTRASSSGGATRWARREGDRHHGHGGGQGGLGERDGRKRNVGQGTDPEVTLLFARGASILHDKAAGANLLAREAVAGCEGREVVGV